MSQSELNHNNHSETHHDEHDFDGIKELNNSAPTWIILLFLVTIGFSGMYAIKYFGYPNNGNDQASEYQKRSIKHDEKFVSAKGTNTGVFDFTSAENIEAGAVLYNEKGCIACHGAMGEGNTIGPNLTDNFWIHGCSTDNLAQIIANGVPEKGMTPYKSMLSEKQINQIIGYIQHKLVGSNPANGKLPQGDECKPQ